MTFRYTRLPTYEHMGDAQSPPPLPQSHSRKPSKPVQDAPQKKPWRWQVLHTNRRNVVIVATLLSVRLFRFYPL